MRDGIVFYRSFYDAIKGLPDAELAKCFKAIMEYGLNELEPDTNGIERAIFCLIKPQIDANNKRYQNGTKGGRPRTEQEPSDNQEITKTEPSYNQDVTTPKPKEKDKEKDKVKEKVKDKTFVPPTVGDVEEYCRQCGCTRVNAEAFVDFYSSKGWMVGKNKMKDWKAAVRNWNRSQRPEMTAKVKPKNGFHNLEEHGYDYEKLVQDLMNDGA